MAAQDMFGATQCGGVKGLEISGTIMPMVLLRCA